MNQRREVLHAAHGLLLRSHGKSLREQVTQRAFIRRHPSFPHGCATPPNPDKMHLIKLSRFASFSRMTFQVRDQIFTICGICLGLSAENTITSIQRWMSNSTSLTNRLQVVASISQFANTCFLTCYIGLPARAFGNNCHEWSLAGCMLYSTFQLTSSGIMISRAGVLIRRKWRPLIHAAGFALLLAGLGFALAGAILRPSFVDALGYCQTDFNWKGTNNIGKSILIALYFGLLMCFMIPLGQQIYASYSNFGGGDVTDSLIQIAGSFGARVCLAIVGFIVPQFFPLIFAGDANLVGLQGLGFVIQNYCAVVASALVMEKQVRSDKSDVAQERMITRQAASTRKSSRSSCPPVPE
ncbi:hypothetical protein BJ741DRAFT_243188 [Chytriomyces cf. hyalinus JEL632]|nr:hypothetical protein BJ741DRAFT_243188 [Chytriomyces cf. hyalinus JEL632]